MRARLRRAYRRRPARPRRSRLSVNPADTTTLTGNTTLTIPAGDTDSTGVVTITAVNDDAYTGNFGRWR